MSYSLVKLYELLQSPSRNGLTKPKAIRGSGVKMIAMGEIFANSILDTRINMDRVPINEKELKNYSIQPQDILFARQSLVLDGAGKCVIVKNIVEQTVFESHLIRIRINQKKANPYFIYYLFNSSLGKNKIRSITEQVAAAGIRGSDLIKLEIPCPELNIQNKIAAILIALDEKIFLNKQINDNLQQQISEIYKAWYQDFSCASNVPMIASEYGIIPQGWHYSIVGDLCKSISVTHKFDTDKLIFLNTGDIEDGRFLHENYMAVSEMPGQAKKSIARGDILFSEIRPINRHFAYVNFSAKDYVVSTKLMIIRATSLDSRRLYHFLTSQDVLMELQMQAESRSGTFPQIRFDNVSKLPILIADDKTEVAFTNLLHTVYAQIEHNNLENGKLRALRDNLLPRLMSGELDVSELDI